MWEGADVILETLAKELPFFPCNSNPKWPLKMFSLKHLLMGTAYKPQHNLLVRSIPVFYVSVM